MTDITWPDSLPAYIIEDGYQEQAASLTIESSVDQGAPKSRRRFTALYIPMTMTIITDQDGRAAFDEFYYTTTSIVLPWNWVHPMSQAAVVMRFRLPPPSYVPQGGTDVKITFSVWIIPS